MAGGLPGGLPKITGDTVYGADYNAVQTIVDGVLGTDATYGVGYGYNQVLTSTVVSVTAKITSQQWSALLGDINKVYLHQNGVNLTSVNTNIGNSISTSNVNILYNTITTAKDKRFTAAANQLTSTRLLLPTYASTWGGGRAGIYAVAKVDVGAGQGATNAQYFFNQGGRIVVNGYTTSTFSVSTTQNSNWKTAMAAMTATITASNYSTILANAATYTSVYKNIAFPSPYTANYVEVLANTTDSGATINLRITYEDNHIATGTGPDTVTAGIGADINSFYSTGAFTGVQPTASMVTPFTSITAPAYVTLAAGSSLNVTSYTFLPPSVATGYVAVLFVATGTTTNVASTINSVTGTGLTWIKRASYTGPGAASNVQTLEMWYCVNTGGAVRPTCTITFSNSFDSSAWTVATFSGVRTSDPWGGSSPYYNTGTNRAANVTYSTDENNALALAFFGTNVATVPGAASGFTSIRNQSNVGGTRPEYMSVSYLGLGASQVDSIASATTVINSPWVAIGDALVGI